MDARNPCYVTITITKGVKSGFLKKTLIFAPRNGEVAQLVRASDS